MTINHIFKKLREQNKGQYLMLGFCIFLSVLLVTSFALMYYGPTVQDFLPEGGDTRKMASLLIAVTAVGCLIFTLYASALFFRFKSREYGVFLAMGTPKSCLKPILFKELSMVMLVSTLAGFLASVPVSFGIWKAFSTFLVSTEQMRYRFGFAGFGVGILFTLILALFLFYYGLRFVKRSNIMDILRAGHKTEMVRIIPPWTGKLGIVLIVTGLLLGTGVPTISAYVFNYLMPSAINVTYLLALAGLYLFLLSTVAQANAGKKKQKYYKNLINISMMRFTAKATTKNMCVIALLLLCSLFAVFFGMMYADSADAGVTPNSRAFSIHHPLEEKQVSQEEIFALAGEYEMELTDYNEETAANLVISYQYRDINDNNEYIVVDGVKKNLTLFLSEDIYTQLTGREISVTPGTYKTITPTDYKANIFSIEDGMYEAMNPDTGLSVSLSYGGSIEFDSIFFMSDNPYTYVISNSDYQALTTSLSSQYLERLVLFDVSDQSASYPFAMALLEAYVAHTTDLSNYWGLYDPWEAKAAAEKGEEYGYEGKVNLSMDNAMLLSDWKYSPAFSIITQQDFLQMISVYVMLCLYIFIITLTTIAIMCYVRSISSAVDNKDVFDSLEKLGADKNYSRSILRSQLLHLFLYPTAAGCGLGFLFAICVSVFNDGRLTNPEYRGFLFLLAMMFAIGVILYLIYRQAMKKAEKIVGIAA